MPRIEFEASTRLIIAYFAVLMVAGLGWLRRGRTSDDYFLAGRPHHTGLRGHPGRNVVRRHSWGGGVDLPERPLRLAGLRGPLLCLRRGLRRRPRAAHPAGFPYTIRTRSTRPTEARRPRRGGLHLPPVHPGSYVLMLGVLLQLIFGWPILPAMVVGVVLSTVYVYAGGFQSDVRVNIVQFVLMFAGFIIMLLLRQRLRGRRGLPSGPPRPAPHLARRQLGMHMIAWFFIALWTLVDPSFHQRCYAARTPETAQRGVFVSIGFWMFFDFLTCSVGLYARAGLPDLAEPVMAYPCWPTRSSPRESRGSSSSACSQRSCPLSSAPCSCRASPSRDFVYRLLGGDPDERLNLRTVVGLLSQPPSP